METIIPTAEELMALQAPSIAPPAPKKENEISPPSPAVVQRVKELLNPAPKKAEVSDEDKLAYLQHVLEGSPFIKAFEIYGNQHIAFSTINADTDRYLADVAVRISSTDVEKKQNYAYLCLFESLVGLSLKAIFKRLQKVDPLGTKADNAAILRANIALFSADVLAGVYEAYLAYQKLLNTFAKEACSPNFWKTL